MTVDWAAAIEAEVQRVLVLCDDQVAAYCAWRPRTGTIHQTLYGDLIDFVNFRVETAVSALEMVRTGRVADALGLCRALLENYLLSMLMCRGTRFFRLADLTATPRNQFDVELAEQQQRLAELRESGSPACLEVREHPRLKRHLMFIFEGLKSDNPDDHDFVVPAHYFEFRNFRPEVLRLKRSDYFEYYPQEPELQEALKKHQKAADFSHRHYLSYSALLAGLDLNHMADDAAQKRIEAHYTFLGQFIHPTHDAARQLHERSNEFNGLPSVGMNSPYTREARLLAAAYVAHLLAGLLEEVAGFVEKAPARYISDAGTTRLRTCTRAVSDTVDYLWFAFNDAPPYAKYMWAIHHADDHMLEEYGGYEGIPSTLVTFDQHIYGHFKASLTGWENARCGSYVPPPLRRVGIG